MPPNITTLVYINANGYFYADYPTFLSWITTAYQSIYGADIYLQPDSQDGQFLAILAQAFYDTAALGASVYNSFSPSTAQGVGLSRNVQINGLQRLVPSYSTVTLTIGGTYGTVITNGIASDVLSQQWALPSSVTIPIGGTIDVTATAVEVGFVTADSGTITTVATPTLGWQTVTNAAAATPGSPVETDSELRTRQAISTANPSLTVLAGTQGGIANLTGVTKVLVYENYTNTTNGNGLPPHSICAVVAGGDTTDIANEIMLHKTPGTNTYANTGQGGVYITVHDSNGMPLSIGVQPVVTAEIQVQVTISTGVGWSSDYVSLIQNAVAAQINAQAIGSVIYISQLYAPAYLIGTAPGATFTISSIEIGKNSGGLSSSNITLNFDENPVVNPTVDVTVIT